VKQVLRGCAFLLLFALSFVGLAHAALSDLARWPWLLLILTMYVIGIAAAPSVLVGSAWRSRVATAVALAIGPLVPALGYVYLIGAHPAPNEPLPAWVNVCIPFTALGPSLPSGLVFRVLLVLNVLTWLVVSFLSYLAFRRAFTAPGVSGGQGATHA
jgi:hypothetical protein